MSDDSFRSLFGATRGPEAPNQLRWWRSPEAEVDAVVASWLDEIDKSGIYEGLRHVGGEFFGQLNAVKHLPRRGADTTIMLTTLQSEQLLHAWPEHLRWPDKRQNTWLWGYLRERDARR